MSRHVRNTPAVIRLVARSHGTPWRVGPKPLLAPRKEREEPHLIKGPYLPPMMKHMASRFGQRVLMNDVVYQDLVAVDERVYDVVWRKLCACAPPTN